VSMAGTPKRRGTHPHDLEAHRFLDPNLGRHPLRRGRDQGPTVEKGKNGRLVLVYYVEDETGRKRRRRTKLTTAAYDHGWPGPSDLHTDTLPMLRYRRDSFSPSALVRIERVRDAYQGNLGVLLVPTTTNSQRDYARLARALSVALSGYARHAHGFTLAERFIEESTGWPRGKAGRFIRWARSHQLINRVGHVHTERTWLAFEPDAVPSSIKAAHVYLFTSSAVMLRDGLPVSDGAGATVSASYILEKGIRLHPELKAVLCAPALLAERAHSPPDPPEQPPTTTSTTRAEIAPALSEREATIRLLRDFSAKLNRHPDNRRAERRAREDAELDARLKAEAEERRAPEAGRSLREFLGD
jgi:hypothetical protein